jgi:GxxExxY protein
MQSGTAPARKLSANELSHEIIRAALKVHTALGPGLLESAYQACLAFELREMGFRVETEVPLPVVYNGVKLDCGYRLDLVVEDLVIIELKSIDAIAPVHKAQMISYLKLSRKSLGLLINFNVTHLREGIKRFVEGKSWNKKP